MLVGNLIHNIKTMEKDYRFNLKKADLFSAVNTVLSIFALIHFKMPMGFLFMILVLIYTLLMDVVYKACK